MTDPGLDAIARRERAKAAADNLTKAEEAIRKRREFLVAVAEGKAPPDETTPSIDPVRVAENYVAAKWVQNLAPMRTCCFRCGVDSPIVFAPYGTIAFGGQMGRGEHLARNERDITNDVTLELEKIGWKFQLRRSYCPVCKGLGGI